MHMVALIFFCISFSAHLVVAEETPPMATTMIENVTVVSAHLDQPQQNMDVLIKDGRILDIIPTGTNYPSETVIDGQGKFLIPGLIDSHVHLGHNPIVNREHREERGNLLTRYKMQLPRSFLYFGYTSVIDLDYSSSRSDWLSDAEHAPDVYHCSRGVRFAGGYGPAFVPPKAVHRIFPNLVYEAQHTDEWPEELDPAEYSVAAAVQRVVDAGAICLKTYVESGFGGVFDWSLPSSKTLSELTDLPHRNGLVVVIHANSAEAWLSGIEAGADVIGHGLWHWEGDRRDATLTRDALSAISASLDKGVAIQPTLRVVAGERDTLTWDLSEDARIDHVLPKELIEYLRSAEGRWSQKDLLNLYHRHNPYPEVTPLALIDTSIARATNSLRKIGQSDALLVFGTDTPAQDGIGNPPGLNGYLEMEKWIEAGISLKRILKAATLDNASVFRLDHELGSVERGKQADVLLLNSNPLVSVDAYNDISMVFSNGIPISRNELSEN